MTMSNPTINDVAQQAEVSKATVSAVINDSDSVKDSTRSKVLEVIDQLNYRPRASARRGFRATSSKSIGLIIKELDNPYYSEVTAGVRQYAIQQGYTLLVASSEANYDDEQQIVNVFKAHDISGLLVIPVLDEKTDLSYLYELKRRNFPFVLLEEIQGVQASLVDIDNVSASKKAAKYFIDQGYTDIVHFAGPAYSTHSNERVEGVRRAFSESQLVYHEDVIVPVGAHLEDGYEKGKAYFQNRSLGNGPVAVTCYNDLVAIGLLRALRELNIDVPEEVAIIGCDDIGILQFLSLPLSSIRIPRYEMGQKAAEILVRQLESPDKLPPEKVYMESELILRSSTRPIKGAESLISSDGVRAT